MEPINIVTDVSLNEKLLGHLHKVICELLEDINALWENTPKRPSADSWIALSKNPISLKRTHRHSLIFLSKPIDLFIDICGIGKVCVPMKIGWNDLSLLEGTAIALASSDDSMSALYRCTDILD